MRPTTIATLIEGFEVDQPIIDAVKAFAKSKPWRGTIDERKAKFQAFHESLTVACDRCDINLLFGKLDGNCSLESYYKPRMKTIYMKGKLSVVTYLHLFAKAIGKSPMECFKWSLGIFASRFPLSFSNCRQEGLFLTR